MDNHFKSFAMTLAVKKFYQSRLSLQLKEKNNLTRIEVNQNLADKILMRKKQFWEGNIKNIMVAEGDPKVFNSPCTYEVESKRTKFKDLCSQVMEEHSDDDESKEEEMSNTDTTPEMKDEDRSREIIKLDLIRGRDVIENENKEDFARIISSGLIEEISFNVFVNPTK